ncbi:MAG: hypothetical protein H0X62_07355 [Bacteroidetes bacterium]|nr:hypothetical protein [Bacteroidota bacterium]
MKYYLTILAAFVALNLQSTKTWAQETEPEKESYKHGLGIGAGFTTGYGLSYRFFPGKLGFQLNLAPYKTAETARYSAGLTFIYPIIPGNITTLYIYQGNHFLYSSERIYFEDNTRTIESWEPTEFTGQRVDQFFNHGIGFGMEIVFAKRMGLNLMAGYAAYDNFKMLNVTGETALYFKF